MRQITAKEMRAHTEDINKPGVSNEILFDIIFQNMRNGYAIASHLTPEQMDMLVSLEYNIETIETEADPKHYKISW